MVRSGLRCTVAIAALAGCGDDAPTPPGTAEDPELARYPSARLPFRAEPSLYQSAVKVLDHTTRNAPPDQQRTHTLREYSLLDVATLPDLVIVIYKPDVGRDLHAAIGGRDRPWTTTPIWTYTLESDGDGAPEAVRAFADVAEGVVYVAINIRGTGVDLVRVDPASPASATVERVTPGRGLTRCQSLDLARSPGGSLDVLVGDSLVRKAPGDVWRAQVLRDPSEPFPTLSFGLNTGCRARLTYDETDEPVVLVSQHVIHAGNSDDTMVGKANAQRFYFRGANGVYQPNSVWARQMHWDESAVMTHVVRHPDGYPLAGPARLRMSTAGGQIDTAWLEPFSPRGINGRDQPGGEPESDPGESAYAVPCGGPCSFVGQQPEDTIGLHVNACGQFTSASIALRVDAFDNGGPPQLIPFLPTIGSGPGTCPASARAAVVSRPADTSETLITWAAMTRYDAPAMAVVCLDTEGTLTICEGGLQLADELAVGAPLMRREEVPEIVGASVAAGAMVDVDLSSITVTVAPWRGDAPVAAVLSDVSRGDQHVVDVTADAAAHTLTVAWTYPLRAGHRYRLALVDGSDPAGRTNAHVEEGRSRTLSFRTSGDTIFDHADPRAQTERVLDCTQVFPFGGTLDGLGRCVVPVPPDYDGALGFGVYRPGAPFPLPVRLYDGSRVEVTLIAADYSVLFGNYSRLAWAGLTPGETYTLEFPSLVDEYGVPAPVAQRTFVLDVQP